MCLYTKQLKPSVARKDIICYKRMIIRRNVLRSSVRNSKYIIGKLHQAKIGIPSLPFPINWLGTSFSTVLKGLHSYSSLRAATRRKNSYEVIVQCTIPKGSLYYKGAMSELVSNQLIIDKIL